MTGILSREQDILFESHRDGLTIYDARRTSLVEIVYQMPLSSAPPR